MRSIRLYPRTIGTAALFTAMLGATVLSAPSLGAQNVNNSNPISTGVTLSTISGFFTPGSGAVAQGGSVSFAAVSVITNSLSSGTLASPMTGANISPSVGAQVAALLAGTPGSLSALQTQLNATGAPTAETANLLLALAGLTKNGAGGRSGDTDRPAVVRALNAFNAMVNASSPEFLASAPPAIIAIHAVLSSLTEAGNKRA